MNPIELTEKVEKLEKIVNELSKKVLELGQLNVCINLSVISLNNRVKELEKKFDEIKED